MEYRTKEEQVADYLREGIISGRLARGARLKQTEIAQELKISITPVREALKLLEAEGYLSSDSYRGATVAPFDVGASTEILKLRITLETQLVESAVRNVTVDNIAELRDLAMQFEQAARANDSTAARGINYRLHRRIYDFANLPKTLHFVQVLWAQYPFDVINRISGRALRAAEEHSELLRSVIEGDAAGAMLTMRRHIEAGWGEFRKSLDETSSKTTSINSRTTERRDLMTAMLLVMDMLNDLVHENGGGAKTYVPLMKDRNVLARTKAAIDKARAADALIGYVRVGFSPDYRECPPNSPIFSRARSAGMFKLGTWGTEVHPDVAPQAADFDIVKHRVSPFYGTSLEPILRARGITELFLCGVSTNGVVHSGAREGHDRDYACTVLEDCCAGATVDEHESALRCVARFAAIKNSAEVTFA